MILFTNLVYSQTPPSFDTLERLKKEALKDYDNLYLCYAKTWSEHGENQIISTEKSLKKANVKPKDIVAISARLLFINSKYCLNEKERSAFNMYRYIVASGTKSNGYLEEKDGMIVEQSRMIAEDIATMQIFRFGR
jgi:hypothetical protein